MSADATPVPGIDALVQQAARVVASARARAATLAIAESATGGLVGHLLTEVPGASEVFQGGWVTYANDRKVEDLGVHRATLERHGAVSQQVVETMAQGARKRAGTTHAVATSGITGPGGGSEEKPVGTLWLAVAGPDGVDAHRVLVPDTGRSAVKRAFAGAALDALERALADTAHAAPGVTPGDPRA